MDLRPRRKQRGRWGHVLAFCLGFGACAGLGRALVGVPVSASSPGSFNLGSPARVVKAVGSAVVSLESFSTDAAPENPWTRWFQGPVPTDAAEPSGVASGVLISQDGYIVTNNHVVDGAVRLKARLADEREFEAQVVGTDPHSDLAVVRIKGHEFAQFARFGNSRALVPGDSVVAIGNPLGFEQSVSVGVVSANRRGPFRVGSQTLGDMIQTDAAINQGNSGGGLFGADGSLIGINTAIMVPRGGNGSIGIGFAVPAHRAKPVIDSLIRKGKVLRPWLGIRYRAAEGGLLTHRARPGIGVLVEDVLAGSPASRAGLQAADILQRIGEFRIRSADDLYLFSDRYRAGQRVRAQVMRGGEVRTVELTLAEMPRE